MTSLSMHNLKPAKGSKKYPKAVGRGGGSGKGTTAGRGGKGQTARTGGRNKLKLLGMRHIILATPKLRGFQSQKAKAVVVSLGRIDSAFSAGEMVNPRTLAKKGLIASGSTKRVKILADGSLKKKITVSGCSVSGQAKEKIVAAGGEVRE